MVRMQLSESRYVESETENYGYMIWSVGRQIESRWAWSLILSWSTVALEETSADARM